MNEYFTLETHDRVAHLQLNRPERLNALAPSFFPALRDAVRGLDEAGRTGALVISSTGRHFCAGMALDVFAADDGLLDTATPRGRLAFQRALKVLMDCFTALDDARFPVVCAIQGGCVGGGLDLAAACDIRVCSADAFFTVQEIAIGMAADLGILQRLPKLVPAGMTREMAYTGDRVGAERALAVGLVNAVLPDAAATVEHALGPGPAHRRPLAARHRGQQARPQPRARPRHRRRAGADDAAAERDLRHRGDGDGHRRVEGQARCRLRAAGGRAGASRERREQALD
jgi:enoyl-CoA hydratase